MKLYDEGYEDGLQFDTLVISIEKGSGPVSRK